MSRYIIDTENDGLLNTITKNWIVGLTDIDTKEEFDYLEGDLGWQDKINKATMIVGHNIIGYDLPVFKRIFNWELPKSVTVHDSMLMSQAQDYRRFQNEGHSLEAWGTFLHSPKIEFSDFSKYSPEMLTYCIQDRRLNLKVYEYLLRELKDLLKISPSFKNSLQNEHVVAKFCARAHEVGWLMDKDGLVNLLQRMEQEMYTTETEIVPLLKARIKPVDMLNGEVDWKEPAWVKNGNYAKRTAAWFDIEVDTGQDDDRLVEGAYSRIEIVNPDMSNMGDIKAFLFDIGWEPDDWNYKKNEYGISEPTTPKLSEESLLALGRYGELINEYTTTKSRHGILSGWLHNLDSGNRLHGSCFTIATPTGRARHSLLVNVPNAEAKWGKEIRNLFLASPGKKIIGADSSGNQFRALCHYLKDKEYTQTVLTGDIHQKHADILTSILHEMGILSSDKVVARKTAKPFIYAFLFGAGGEKLSLIVLGKRNKKTGNALKNEFIKRVPGLEELVKKLNKIYYRTEQYGLPYIPGIDGTRIYCDSSHKALNYLLQRFEAISCKAAVAYMCKKLEEEGIPYTPLIWYHDEDEIEVDERDVQRASEISEEAYRVSGRVFGMMILDGKSKIGNTWYDVH